MNGSCLSFGARLNNSYCDINSEILPQKELGEECQNDYECINKRCISGKCKHLEPKKSWWRRLLDFLF